MFKKHMGPHGEPDLLMADSNLDYKFEQNLPLSSPFNIQFSNIKYYKTKDNTINHPQDYPSALLLQIRPITNLGGK